jgi:fatty-acyl-CoA synthase
MGLVAGAARWEAEPFGSRLLETTIGDMLDRQSEAFADRPALIFDDAPFGAPVHWTYAELRSEVDRLARGLMALGIEHGTRVAVLAPNAPEWVLLEYALAKVGGILVTVNTAYKAGELRYLLKQGEVHTLFTVAAFRGYGFQEALSDIRLNDGVAHSPELPCLRHIVRIGPGEWSGALAWSDVLNLGASVFREELESRQRSVSPHDTSQIQYTSGTTGAPKGAMLTHFSTLNNANLMGDRAGFSSNDRTISAMPLFHTAGCVCNVLGVMVKGGCLIEMPAFDANRMLHLIAKHRATVLNAVPTMLIRMLEDPEFGSGAIDCSSLRIAFTGGTTIPPSLMRDLKERMGTEPMIIMGMTETSPLITQTINSDDFETRISTAGVPLPFTEIEIVREDGTLASCGEPGELRIRGYLVMKGYFGMPDRTAETIDHNGWLRSGDLGVLEATGHLRIVGRIKDMVIRGGENIYPAEIEDLLMSHPEVSQAQVVGVPDPVMGEEAFAFVVARSAGAVDEAALRAFCASQISRHKVPRYFMFADALPLTASGKVKKFELRELAKSQLARGA